MSVHKKLFTMRRKTAFRKIIVHNSPCCFQDIAFVVLPTKKDGNNMNKKKVKANKTKTRTAVLSFTNVCTFLVPCLNF